MFSLGKCTPTGENQEAIGKWLDPVQVETSEIMKELPVRMVNTDITCKITFL